MTFPAGVTTATIAAGVPFDVLGDDGTVTLTVKPYFGGTAARIIHAASGRPFVATERAGTPASGSATVVVPHVDQSGFVDGTGAAVSMWSYLCTVTMTVQGKTTTWTQAVQPLVGQTTIDLDLVTDGTVGAPSSSPVPAVTSVNGMTGAVTVTLAAPVRFSAETATTGSTGSDRASVARTITEARMRVGTAPVGSALTVEVQHHNGSAWSTVTTLTVTAGSTTEAVQTGLSQAQSVGHLIRLNVTSVGSTTSAGDVVVDVITT